MASGVRILEHVWVAAFFDQSVYSRALARIERRVARFGNPDSPFFFPVNMAEIPNFVENSASAGVVLLKQGHCCS
jgi:hypothetical protein